MITRKFRREFVNLAPAVFSGPIDTSTFLAYIEQVPVRTLRPGEVVVRDNLAVHKQPEVRTAIEAVGAQLRFLPSYSPEFNPIELAFAKRKVLPLGRPSAILRSRLRPHRRGISAEVAEWWTIRKGQRSSRQRFAGPTMSSSRAKLAPALSRCTRSASLTHFTAKDLRLDRAPRRGKADGDFGLQSSVFKCKGRRRPPAPRPIAAPRPPRTAPNARMTGTGTSSASQRPS